VTKGSVPRQPHDKFAERWQRVCLIVYFDTKEQGATMNLQTALKLLLASSVAACCALPANAQTVDTELTGTVSSLQGSGWAHSDIGQPVALDFAYDASTVSSSSSNGFYIVSAPITSASIVGGVLGSGINLEPDGPGTGTVANILNLNTGSVTAGAVTSADAPVHGFTGSVFGLSFFTDGVNTTLDVVRNAFVNGIPDARDSGSAFLSNVNVVAGGQAPEIDPASALSALTLLLGGLAVIRGKKFAKVPGV
jgi:hypothetical protein